MSGERGVLVVTGGGRGIGAATARAAAEQGWNLCLCYRRDREAALDVAADCEAHGAEVAVLCADVAVEMDILELFARAEDMGPVRGLVNNAGIAAPRGALVELESDALEDLFGVNVFGTMLCAREAVRLMQRDGEGGAIVNVSSRAAVGGSPGEYVHYAASKGAVDAFTVGLAKEVAEHGIRVNAVRPGLIATDIHATNGRPERLAALAPTVPLGRPGTAEEVAAAIVWLLSPVASYVTGTLLDVGGGR